MSTIQRCAAVDGWPNCRSRATPLFPRERGRRCGKTPRELVLHALIEARHIYDHSHVRAVADQFALVPRLHDEEPRSAEDLIALGVRDVLKNVFDTERFRSEYRPGALRTAGVWVTGFFRHDASAMLGHEGFVALDW